MRGAQHSCSFVGFKCLQLCLILVSREQSFSNKHILASIKIIHHAPDISSLRRGAIVVSWSLLVVRKSCSLWWHYGCGGWLRRLKRWRIVRDHPAIISHYTNHNTSNRQNPSNTWTRCLFILVLISVSLHYCGLIGNLEMLPQLAPPLHMQSEANLKIISPKAGPMVKRPHICFLKTPQTHRLLN